jgi:hypothetical protein
MVPTQQVRKWGVWMLNNATWAPTLLLLITPAHDAAFLIVATDAALIEDGK